MIEDINLEHLYGIKDLSYAIEEGKVKVQRDHYFTHPQHKLPPVFIDDALRLPSQFAPRQVHQQGENLYFLLSGLQDFFNLPEEKRVRYYTSREILLNTSFRDCRTLEDYIERRKLPFRACNGSGKIFPQETAAILRREKPFVEEIEEATTYA